MSDADLLASAAAALADITADIKPDQLTARTPCADFDVRALLNHLLFWGPSLEAAGRKESVPPPAASESDVDLVTDGYATVLRTHLDRVATTWRAPAAWTGVTRMGGPTEMPGAVIGRMLTTELLVHGWDLARATGQRPTWDAGLVDAVHAEVTANAAQGRAMGVYGPAVEVPATASTMDRALAMTGRDPAWTPGG
jgi:uncharacterized protein (TIGR03086 family)